MTVSSRLAVALVVFVLVLSAGCTGEPDGEQPTGTISVTITNEDSVSHPASVVVRRNGTATTELGVNAVQPGSNVRFESNETGENFTVELRAGPSTQSFDWSPAQCTHRVVEVTIGANQTFETTDRCRSE